MDQATRNSGIVVATGDVPWAPLSVLIRFEPGEPSEFLILEGSGTHPAVGDFKAGDYVYEHTGAYHAPSTYHEPTKLLMVSYGPCSMLDANGNLDFVLDTGFLRRQTAAGR
jgi:hypothetical protein